MGANESKPPTKEKITNQNNEPIQPKKQKNFSKNRILNNVKEEEEENYLKLFGAIKDTILGTASTLNKNNVAFYLIYFFIFFFLYFTLTAKYINSYFEFIYERNKTNKRFLWLYYGILSLFILLWAAYFAFSFKHLDKEGTQLTIISSGILLIFLLCNFCQVFFKYITMYIPDIVVRVLLGMFLIMNIIFFIFYVAMYFLNVNKFLNIEAFIAFEVIIIFYIINTSNVLYNEKIIYTNLNKYDFNFQSLNCLVFNQPESYESNNNVNNIFYINQLLKEKGYDYLEFKYNIPIKYKNKETNKMENLTLADFYYPGVYQTYLADSPLNGTPNEEALIKAFTFCKTRIITLDIYSNISNEFSNDALPVVRPKNLKEGAIPLYLDKCFEIINDYAWIPNNKNEIAYPFFLVLEFHFDDQNNILYEKIRSLLLKYFKKYLMSYKYDFNGHNGTDFINQAPIEECLGKIIIITNKYPVGPLNELVNCSIGKEAPNNTNNSISMDLYTEDMVKFEKVGASQKYNKNELTEYCQSKIKFFHSIPNKEYKNNEQAKAGLYNPSFQDVAQYGVQSTLMYLYLPDPNLNKWYLYFKNKSNFDPILKSESLRNTKIKENIIEPQKEIQGIGKPQKYCLMEGNDGKCNFLNTEKSNIGNGTQNNSFKN
jgi:hypothetical protein